MDREEFIEKKRLEIQEEVDFLISEKNDAYKESDKLYAEIKDKIENLKHNVKKEELANKRLELIDESGVQTYGVYVNDVLRPSYSINRSLRSLDSLAKSTFDIEEFGGLLEEKEKETKKAFNKIDLQVEQNALLSDMVRLLGEMKKDNELKSAVINRNSLSKALSSQYNREL